MKSKFIRCWSLTGLLIFIMGISNLSAGEIYKSFFSSVAINGYDPVNYFTNGSAEKGSPDIKFKWKGAIWYFKTQQNKTLFKSDPKTYAPQYGGHCANGMSEGHKVSSDQTLWRIIERKLFMFYSKKGRDRWSSNTDQWIKDANKNWLVLKHD
jgi:YHS domain-containing protein